MLLVVYRGLLADGERSLHVLRLCAVCFSDVSLAFGFALARGVYGRTVNLNVF